MDLTIEIPHDASAVVIRPCRHAAEKTRAELAGALEYDSWKTDTAEYDSWLAAPDTRPGAR